jgi:hypothetical protein
VSKKPTSTTDSSSISSSSSSDTDASSTVQSSDDTAAAKARRKKEAKKAKLAEAEAQRKAKEAAKKKALAATASKVATAGADDSISSSTESSTASGDVTPLAKKPSKKEKVDAKADAKANAKADVAADGKVDAKAAADTKPADKKPKVTRKHPGAVAKTGEAKAGDDALKPSDTIAPSELGGTARYDTDSTSSDDDAVVVTATSDTEESLDTVTSDLTSDDDDRADGISQSSSAVSSLSPIAVVDVAVPNADAAVAAPTIPVALVVDRRGAHNEISALYDDLSTAPTIDKAGVIKALRAVGVSGPEAVRLAQSNKAARTADEFVELVTPQAHTRAAAALRALLCRHDAFGSGEVAMHHMLHALEKCRLTDTTFPRVATFKLRPAGKKQGLHLECTSLIGNTDVAHVPFSLVTDRSLLALSDGEWVLRTPSRLDTVMCRAGKAAVAPDAVLAFGVLCFTAACLGHAALDGGHRVDYEAFLEAFAHGPATVAAKAQRISKPMDVVVEHLLKAREQAGGHAVLRPFLSTAATAAARRAAAFPPATASGTKYLHPPRTADAVPLVKTVTFASVLLSGYHDADRVTEQSALFALVSIIDDRNNVLPAVQLPATAGERGDEWSFDADTTLFFQCTARDILYVEYCVKLTAADDAFCVAFSTMALADCAEDEAQDAMDVEMWVNGGTFFSRRAPKKKKSAGGCFVCADVEEETLLGAHVAPVPEEIAVASLPERFICPLKHLDVLIRFRAHVIKCTEAAACQGCDAVARQHVVRCAADIIADDAQLDALASYWDTVVVKMDDKDKKDAQKMADAMAETWLTYGAVSNVDGSGTNVVKVLLSKEREVTIGTNNAPLRPLGWAYAGPL